MAILKIYVKPRFIKPKGVRDPISWYVSLLVSIMVFPFIFTYSYILFFSIFIFRRESRNKTKFYGFDNNAKVIYFFHKYIFGYKITKLNNLIDQKNYLKIPGCLDLGNDYVLTNYSNIKLIEFNIEVPNLTKLAAVKYIHKN